MSLDELNAEDGILEIDSPWENFDKLPDGSSAICKSCNRTFKTTGGNTTGLRYHLKTHKIVAKIKRKRKQSDNSDVASKSLMKSRIGAGTSFLATEQSVMGILARLTSKRGLSFKLFEDEDMRACIDALMILLKRKERMPKTDKTIRSYVMKYYQRVKEAVIESIRHLKSVGTKFSLVFDEWSSVANRRYMNVSIFAPENLYWSLGLIKITGSATAERLMELLLERLEEFGIDYNDDIVAITTDGAATMIKLGKDESAAQHQLCLIHGVHLAVVDVLYENKRLTASDPADESPLDSSHDDITNEEETECLEGFDFVEGEEEVVLQDVNIRDTIGKIRQLGRYFKKSPPNNEILQEYVYTKFNNRESKKLLVDSKTRWNSLYTMLERYLEIEDCLDKTLIDIRSKISISQKEKYIIQSIVTTLKPVESVIIKLSARNTNLHQAYLAIKWLFAELQLHDNPLTNKFAQRLYIRMKERFTINFGVMKYLASGSFANVIPTPERPNNDVVHLYNFDPKVNDDEPTTDNDLALKKRDEDFLLYFSLFDVVNKRTIRTHLLKLINILFHPVDEASEPVPVEVPALAASSRKSFDEELSALFADAEKRSNPVESHDSSDISKKLTAEMNHFEKAGERTGYLIKLYSALKTVKPTSVESERSFSQAAQICTKFRSRLRDDTLDSLSFLRSFFANPMVYKDL